MAQIICILFLATWVGFGAYLYKTDYKFTKYWHPTTGGFWVDIALRSFGRALGTFVASIIIFAIVGTAVGFIR